MSSKHNDQKAGKGFPTITATDMENQHKPFPTTPIQTAYIMGRDARFELGGIGTHGLKVFEWSFDPQRFERALNMLIERHPMLRSVFTEDGRQKILEEIPVYKMEVVDLRDQTPAAREAVLQSERNRIAETVYDPKQWPMFEFKTFRISDEINQLFINIDLLLADGASTQIIIHETKHFYFTPEEPLPPIDINFRDYMLAYPEIRKSKRYQKAKAYWQSRIADFPEANHLPLAKRPADIKNMAFDRRDLELSREQTQAIMTLAKEKRVSLPTLVATAYARVLAYWGNEEKAAINFTVFNRYPLHEHVNRILGDFTSIVLVDFSFEAGQTFVDHAKSAHRNLLRALKNRYYEGVSFIRDLALARDTGTKAGYPYVFTSMIYDDGSTPYPAFGEEIWGISRTPQVLLDCQTSLRDGHLHVDWDFPVEAFSPETIDEMFAHFQQTLEQLAETGNALPLTAPQRHQDFAARYNDREDESIQPELLQQGFIRQAETRPERIAVKQGERGITYGDLFKRANQIAHFLIERGIGQGDFVAVLGERDIDSIANVLGVLFSGAAYVPIDPDYPEDRQNYIYENSGCKFQLNRHSYEAENIARFSSNHPGNRQTVEDLSYIIYTSGSTGRPKGVVLRHAAAVNTIIDINRRFNLNPEDRVLQISSLGFDLSVWDVFGTLSAGACLVLIPTPKDLAALGDSVNQEQITVWNSVPAIMDMMLEEKGPDFRAPSLRLAMLSGDWIPLRLAGNARRAFGDLQLISLGGATEGAIWSIYFPIEKIENHWRSIPYGYPLANQKFFVLDSSRRICPIGVEGELYIGGKGVAEGYKNEPEKTEAAFIHDPELGYIYKTGDYGVWREEGWIEFLGRRDFQVKIRGYRIELGEIESVVLSHEQINNAAVIDRVDESGKKYLAAYIVSQTGVSAAEMRAFLSDLLPDYMIPTAFVAVDEIPLTANGKVDKKALPDPNQTNALPSGSASRTIGNDDAMSGNRALLAEMWREVLHIEEVGIHDNFFDLGGDSLKIQHLINQTEKKTGIRVPIAELFKRQTIADLAAYLDQASGAGGESKRRKKGLLTPAELLSDHKDLFAKSHGQVLADADHYYAFKKQSQNRDFEASGEETYQLPKGQVPEELVNRRSVRGFDKKQKLDLEQLGAWLSILRQEDRDGKARRFYPSAGGLYPLDLFLYVKKDRVRGLESGLYYYHPASNQLRIVDRECRIGEADHYFHNRSVFSGSAVSLFMVYNAEANMPVYNESGYLYACIEAGVVLQLLTGQAARLGLGLCSIGDLHFRNIAAAFKLGKNRVFLHDIELGIAAVNHVQAEELPEKLALEAADRGRDFPLTGPQNRLYILCQLDPDGIAYNGPIVQLIEGSFDREQFETIMQTIFRRHEAFRTGFHMVEGRPMARLVENAQLHIQYLEAEENQVDNVIRSLIKPFDLAKAPLFRVAVIRLDENRHLLFTDSHHIITDLSSGAVMLSEMMRLYSGQNLEPIRMQYREFARLQAEQGEPDESLENYWAAVYQDIPPRLELPTDRPRPAVRNFRGARVHHLIEGNVGKRFKQIGQEQGCTLFMSLLGAYNLLLSRYGAREDIVVGSPIAGRDREEIENVVGMFANTLTFRNQVDPNLSFAQFLKQVRQGAVGAFSHASYPFEKLVEKLNLPVERNRNPLFDTMFVLQNMDMPELQTESFTISPYPFESGVAKFDITLEVRESEAGLHMQLEYAVDLFDRETMIRFAHHFENLIKALADAPHEPMATIQMLGEGEKNRLRLLAEGGSRDFDREAGVIDLFNQAVSRYPDAPALVTAQNTFSYTALADTARHLAAKIAAADVSRGEPVAVLPSSPADAVIAFLAVNMAGAAYLPLDPKQPTARLATVLQQAKVRFILGEANGALAENRELIPFQADQISESNFTPVAARGEDIAYVIFTSGSTGVPKGVAVTHRGLANLNLVWNQDFGVTHGDRVLLFANPTFDASISEFTMALFNGAALHVPETEEREDYRRFEDYLNQQQISVVTLPPPFARHLDPTRVEHLRLLITAGSATDRELVDAWRDKVRYINAYGPTETTILATFADLSARAPEAPITIGKPPANVRAFVLDIHGNLAADGVPGELCIAGANLAAGYLHRPDLTAKAYAPHSITDGEPLYRTGDLVKRDADGFLYFLGRIDKQVKIRGFRVELGDIEAALNRLDNVRDCAVIARQDHGDTYLLAYLVPQGEFDAKQAQVRLRERLPEYMVPSRFMTLEYLPLNSSGKVDTARLPQPEGPDLAVTVPETSTGRALAELWAQVLKVPVAAVGMESDFFQLGGHSLRATQLLTLIYRQLGRELSLAQLFAHSNLAEQIALLDHTERKTYEAITAHPAQSEYPLSFQQENFFFLQLMEPTSRNLNMPMAVSLKGAVDRDRLEAVFNQVIAANPILRTGFHLGEQGPVQRVEEQVAFQLGLNEQKPGDLQGYMESLIRPFDLAQAPLIRAELIRTANDEHTLFIDMHHIISDGTSQVLFLKAFAQAFAGETLSIKELGYGDFAMWQRERLEKGALKQSEAWWLEHLSGELPKLDLPLDFPRDAGTAPKAETVHFQISNQELKAVEQLCRENGVTLYMFLLAAYQVMLGKLGGQEDIIVGTPAAGRNHPQLHDQLGLFIDNIALRGQVSGEKTFRQFLAETKHICLNGFQHADYPYKVLVDKLNVKTEVGRAGLFDAALILQNIEFEQVNIEGLAMTAFEHVNRYAKLDLTLDIMQVEQGLDCSLDYAPNRFRRETAERFATFFRNLVQDLARFANRGLAEFVLNDDPQGRPADLLSSYLIGDGSLVTRCGDMLLRRGHEILGVFSNDAETLAWARARDIAAHRAKRGVPAEILATRPFDFLFSINNGLILKDELRFARRGNINYHDSLLPKYAGVYAGSWALLNGEKQHGITWHLIDEGIDTGDILAQVTVPVDDGETASSLNFKCFAAAADAFSNLIGPLAVGAETRTPQDPARQTYFAYHKRPYAAAYLDPHVDGEQLDRMVRALSFGTYDNFLALPKLVSGRHAALVTRAELQSDAPKDQPGVILYADQEHFVLGTTGSALAVKQLKQLDGQALTVAQWLEQTGLNAGDRLQKPDLDPDHLDALNARLATHEDFWIKRLSYLEPVVLAHRGSDIEEADPNQVRRIIFPFPKGLRHRHDAHQLIGAAFCAYLARAVDKDRFDIGYLYPGCLPLADDPVNFTAEVLPLHIHLPGGRSIGEIGRKLQRELQLLEQKQGFMLDIFARFQHLDQRRDEYAAAASITLARGLSQAQIDRLGSKQLSLALPVDENSMTFIYNTGVFTSESIKHLIEGFLPYLERIMRSHSEPWGEHELVTLEQRNQILHQFNNTSGMLSAFEPVHRQFEKTAARYPHRVAVVHGRQQLTYDQVNRRANQLAHHLKQKGVGRETIVAVMVGRNSGRIISLLAVLKAGGAYLPIDPEYPEARITHLIQDSGTRIIIHDQGQLPEAAAALYPLNLNDESSFHENQGNVAGHTNPDDMAYLIYTSGSTGKPKGVVSEHRNLSAYLQAFQAEFQVGPEDRVMQQAGFSFDAFVEEMYPALTVGAAVHIINRETLLDPEALVAYINQEQISLISASPLLLSTLNQHAEQLQVPRILISGGDVLKTAYIDQLVDKTAVYNTYGPTETTVCATYHRVTRDDDANPPIGKSILGYHVYVMDAGQKLKPIGVPGELCIGGPGVARGYLNRPTLTAEKFVANPYREGERIYRTGDLVRFRADGSLDFFGRIDQQVNIRGYRVELGEIESRLVAHPGIQEVAVLLKQVGSGDPVLCAYFTGDAALDGKTLRAFLAQSFPDYMIPTFFTHLTLLPVTSHGKLDSKALPLPSGLDAERTIRDAETAGEETMIAIWREVLGVREISIDDNFFELGGDSIKAITLISRIHQELGSKLGMKDIFASENLRELAQKAAHGKGGESYEIIPKLPKAEHYELSYAQRRMWILYQKNPSSGAFNLPGLLTVKRPVAEQHFIEILEHLKKRHESFRTSFTMVANQPVQIIHDDVPLDYSYQDISRDPDRQSLRKTLYNQFITKPFDLTNPPLVRAKMLKVGEEEFDFMFSMHHIVSDGTSIDILRREMTDIYRAVRRGNQPELPPLPIQYKDFAAWQNQLLHDEDKMKRAKDFWQRKLGGNLPELNLPTDFKVGQVDIRHAAVYRGIIDEALRRRLKKLALDLRVSLAMVLMTTFEILLARLSVSPNILYGIAGAGRDDARLKNIVGFFVNTIILSNQVDGENSFKDLVQIVSKDTLEALEYQNYPLELVFDALNLKYPQLSAFFNMLNVFESVEALENLEPGHEAGARDTKFDITMYVTEFTNAIELKCEYFTGKFKPETIAYITNEYIKLLELVAENPNQAVKDLKTTAKAGGKKLGKGKKLLKKPR